MIMMPLPENAKVHSEDLRKISTLKKPRSPKTQDFFKLMNPNSLPEDKKKVTDKLNSSPERMPLQTEELKTKEDLKSSKVFLKSTKKSNT